MRLGRRVRTRVIRTGVIRTRGLLGFGLVLRAAGCLTLAGCAGAPSGPLPPSDPELITFADELEVDLAAFEKSPTGLYVQELLEGVGARANRGDRVWIHFIGWLPDGSVFDSSIGGEPFQFRMGEGEVIRGWEQGISGMRIGGRRRLIVRPALAYGSRGKGKVPRGATLVFEVQLVDVN